MNRREAFTMIELLVVIAIIGLLIALAFPALMSARGRASRVQCENRLRQLGVALASYHAAAGMLPPAKINPGSYRPAPPNVAFPFLGGGTKNTTGWTLLLPYLEEGALYEAYNMDLCSSANASRSMPWMPVMGSDRANSTAVGTLLKLFVCPSSLRPQTLTHAPDTPSDPYSVRNGRQSSYLFSGGPVNDSSPVFDKLLRHKSQGMFGTNGAADHDLVRDGLSTSIAVGESTHAGETGVHGPFWGAGVTGCCHGTVAENGQTNFRSAHGAGANYLFGDGSVRWIEAGIDAKVLFDFATIHAEDDL